MIEVFEQLEEEIIIVDKNGEIKFSNSKLCKHLGYQVGELEGKSLLKLIGDESIVECLIQKGNKGIPHYVLGLNSKEKGLKPYEMDVIDGKWKGESVWFIKGMPIDEQEQYTKKDLEMILDQIPMMISVKNKEGKYFYINKTTERYCEQTKEGMIGRSDLEVFGEERGRHFDFVDYEIMEQGKEKQVESWVKTPTGKVKVLKLDKLPLYDEQNEVMGVLKVGREQTLSKLLELSQQKKYQQILRATNKEVNWEQIWEEHPKIEISELAITNELQALGCVVWVYDHRQGCLECQFMSEISTECVNVSNGEYFYEEKIRYKFDFKVQTEDNIYPIDQSSMCNEEIKEFIEKFRDKGANYVGVYNINLNGEFLGMMNLFYEKNNSLDGEKIEVAKRISNGLAYLIKQDKLAQELKEEFKKGNEVEEELQHFLETAMDLLFLIKEDGEVIRGGEKFCKLYGEHTEKLMEADLLEKVDLEDREYIRQVKEICKKNGGKTKRLEIGFFDKDKNNLWGECGVRYLADKKEFIWTIRDVTETKKLEEEKGKYEKKLYMEKLRNEFLSNISHELKTPLNIILSTVQLLAGQEKDVTYTRYVEYIRRNGYRLLRLVNNLIDMTRIEAGSYQMNWGNYNIVEVVEDITLSAAKYIEKGGVEIVFDTEFEEEIIRCDPDKIERILLNLISNAIKYNTEKGLIEVHISFDEQSVIVCVKDQGQGIPKEKIESVFDGFMQVDRSLTRLREGSGIGLTLVKGLVELHGGKVYAQSKLGQGTEVKILLPRGVGKEECDQIDYTKLKVGHIEKCHIEFADIYEMS